MIDIKTNVLKTFSQILQYSEMFGIDKRLVSVIVWDKKLAEKLSKNGNFVVYFGTNKFVDSQKSNIRAVTLQYDGSARATELIQKYLGKTLESIFI